MKQEHFLLLFLICATTVFPQVGIDTDTPHEKSALEIVSKGADTGVLFPRLTTAEIEAITPTDGDMVVDGLWVYNTDTQCYNYWVVPPQNQWMELCASTMLGSLPSSKNANHNTNTASLEISGENAMVSASQSSDNSNK